MELYKQYVKEREGVETISTDSGFIMYKIENDKCLICDLYILPELRKQNKGSFFANQVFELCKEMGIKEVHAQVDIRANGHKTSILAIEAFGFKEIGRNTFTIFYKLGVNEWEAQ